MNFKEHEKTKQGPLIVHHIVIQSGMQFKNIFVFYAKIIKGNLNLAQEREFRRTQFLRKDPDMLHSGATWLSGFSGPFMNRGAGCNSGNGFFLEKPVGKWVAIPTVHLRLSGCPSGVDMQSPAGSLCGLFQSTHVLTTRPGGSLSSDASPSSDGSRSRRSPGNGGT